MIFNKGAKTIKQERESLTKESSGVYLPMGSPFFLQTTSTA